MQSNVKSASFTSQFRIRSKRLEAAFSRKYPKGKMHVDIPFEERHPDNIMRFDWDMWSNAQIHLNLDNFKVYIKFCGIFLIKLDFQQ